MARPMDAGGGSGLDDYASPWKWDSPDYQNNRIYFEVYFEEKVAPYNLISATVRVDPGCLFDTMLFGVQSSPTVKKLKGKVGQTTTFNKAQLHSRGLDTLYDVFEIQITAE